MKTLLVLTLSLVASSAYADYFTWKVRAFTGAPPVNLVLKGQDLDLMSPIPNDGSTFSAAGWKCKVDPSTKVWGRTVGSWFLESRSVDCEHSSGAAESQIATCHTDKKSKKVISDKAEVNLMFKGERLYVEISCE